MSINTRVRVIQYIMEMPQGNLFTSSDIAKALKMTSSEVGGIVKSIAGESDDCLVDEHIIEGKKMRNKCWKRL
jgi:alkylated DNA nucleotide flippase Atl1